VTRYSNNINIGDLISSSHCPDENVIGLVVEIDSTTIPEGVLIKIVNGGRMVSVWSDECEVINAAK
tara:strand:+ start:62 stop:259 length:198 start_codon:yes stop_codon:yes gene_type:complete